MPPKDQSINALSKVIDPELYRSLTDLKMVRNLQVSDRSVEMTIDLPPPTDHSKTRSKPTYAPPSLACQKWKSGCSHDRHDRRRAKSDFDELKEGSAVAYNHIQRVVAVMSGKDGVGKSWVTSLLTVALAQSGSAWGCWLPTSPGRASQAVRAARPTGGWPCGAPTTY